MRQPSAAETRRELSVVLRYRVRDGWVGMRVPCGLVGWAEMQLEA